MNVIVNVYQFTYFPKMTAIAFKEEKNLNWLQWYNLQKQQQDSSQSANSHIRVAI